MPFQVKHLDYVMIYSARDRDELGTFWTIVLTAYYHARGLRIQCVRRQFRA